ncbi:MAG: DUF4199 domain-containing protein [Crocinitomicaceae bacterium]
MKTSVKFGFGFALIWIIISMITFYAGLSKETFNLGILINLFLLMTAIAVGLFMTKKENNFEKGNFIRDFKTATQSGVIYAITIAAFVYVYHEMIDPSIRESLIQKRVEVLHEAVPDSEAFQKMKENDPTWKDKSYDDYIENQEDQFKSVFSSFSVFVAHLMGLTFFAMFFAFFVTFIMRKIVLRGSYQD